MDMDVDVKTKRQLRQQNTADAREKLRTLLDKIRHSEQLTEEEVDAARNAVCLVIKELDPVRAESLNDNLKDVVKYYSEQSSH